MTPKHFKIEDPDLLDVSTKPHGVYSLIPPACVMRPLSPTQVVVFPPELPSVMYSRSPTPHRREKDNSCQKSVEIETQSPDRCTACPSPLNALVPYEPKKEPLSVPTERTKTRERSPQRVKKSEKEKSPLREHKAETIKKESVHSKAQKSGEVSKVSETKKNVAKSVETSQDPLHKQMYFSRSEVEKIIHEEVLKALSLKEEKREELDEKIEEEISVHDLPKPTAPSGWMTSALTTASERPFTPVPFAKPLELPSVADRIIPMTPIEVKAEKPVPLPKETTPYFPPPPPPPDQEGRDVRTARALREVGCRSPMTEALTVAPQRSYSPLPSFTEVKQTEKPFKPIPTSSKKQMNLSSALTVAPTVPFTVPGKTPIPSDSTLSDHEARPTGFKPVVPTFIQEKEKYGVDMTGIAKAGHTKETVKMIESGKFVSKSSREAASVSPVPQPSIATSTKPMEPWIPHLNKPKQEKHISRKEAHEMTQTDKIEILETKTIPQRPLTPSGLHPPQELPYYQQNIGIIPVRNKSVSPVPHIIKAPTISPAPTTMQQGYKSTVYSETKTYSAQKSSSKTLATTNITTTKELVSPEKQLTPAWKMETKRTIQNLSPITVRLPSPRPVTPAQGETLQAANVKVQIHKPRPSSPLPPKIKVEVDYPAVPSAAPSIGSEKSAFAPVKNGSNQSKKSVEASSCDQSCTSKSEVCQKSNCDATLCKKEVACCKKSSQEQLQSKGSAISVSEKVTSSEVMEQKSAIQERSSRISSFRVYGQSTNKTMSNEEFDKSSANIKLERAVQSKMYKENTFSNKTCSLADQSSSQNKTRTVEQKKSERNASRNIETKTNSPASIGGILGGVKCQGAGQTPTPLPTFPSLPHVSDVPRTPGAGGGPGGRTGTLAGSSAPKRGRGILNPQVPPGARIPLCGHCNNQIRYSYCRVASL